MGFADHRTALEEGRYLRVVNYHNTPSSTAAQLREELAAYAKAFACVTVADLDRFYATGEWGLDRPGFIPVFYEGYRNNHTVAAPICDDLGLTAWFPIITRFVDCPPAEQRAFADAHDIDLVEEELSYDRLALTWDEVAELGQRHVVVPHTGSHSPIGAITTAADVERELVEPRRRIQEVTGQEAVANVYLYGTPFGTSGFQDRAVLDAGYRYQISNTMIQRIA
ncbi:polysaccharide deacetylase family protein [Herbidospora daliensis]|uniref:polysaccharide deacetylase family protein n=1 Tax=Herbidospora daliensis TaxID=295585 RepID=UPI000781BB31|nr:polysaccharide deacetylase family protein [Herbidospora daliensis]